MCHSSQNKNIQSPSKRLWYYSLCMQVWTRKHLHNFFFYSTTMHPIIQILPRMSVLLLLQCVNGRTVIITYRIMWLFFFLKRGAQMFIEPRWRIRRSDLIWADIKRLLSVGVQMETSFSLIRNSLNLLRRIKQLFGFCAQLKSELL